MTFDAIVIGLGAMGSATVRELNRRGQRVLGLEQFALGHHRGSSHGATRIIRTAYYEHPDYVPLVRQAFPMWEELERDTQATLLTRIPCLSLGSSDSAMIAGVRRATLEHRLAVEALDETELRKRFPQFQIEGGTVGLLESDAGALRVEAGVKAFQSAALRTGLAELRSEETVRSWKATSNGVEVTTEKGIYSAAKLIITAGSWAGGLLRDLGMPLSIMRQVQLWFGTADDRLFRRDRFPIYLADVDGAFFYGLPVIDGHGHKVARHYGAPELPDPDAVDRAVTASDEIAVRAFLNAHLPAVNGPRRRGQVCTYTLTPDRHFILDQHPDHANVAVAAGFSGHGFKFAPVVGEIMADLVTTGTTSHPIEMFRIGRFDAERTPAPSTYR